MEGNDWIASLTSRGLRVQALARPDRLGARHGGEHQVEPGARGAGDLTIGYSESKDLRGVAKLVGNLAERAGFVPKKRLLIGIGEWVTDGFRVAFEYVYIKDYSRNDGGTGRHANGVFTMLTYEW